MIQDSTVINLLEAGLRAEGLRQQTIANNVANINTEGFRRSDIKFEQALQKAMGQDGSFDLEKVEVETFQPLNTSINEYGSDVNLDSEVGELVKNSIRHRTYMLVLKKKYTQMDDAMRTP
ncbi:MAG: flagellar basal body protein [Planctomycetaceae bacterium]|nr:flagellar basal body protein [Planctomycetaceae bacterium]